MGKRALLFLTLIAFIVPASLWLWLQSAPIAAIERGGAGPPTIVLLHGYGSRAEDWLQFEERWQFPANARRVYPQAPWRGFGSHRGWWWLHLEGHVKQGDQHPDLSRSSPGGIKVASGLVRTLIKGAKQPLILGGFSQGAMTAAEVAFQTDQEMAALILLSGATVNEERWAEHFAGRRRLPIFIAHGRSDRVLSFEIMERFQQRLKTFGLNVTWFPFNGAHEIPPDVVDEVNAFVQRVLQLESTTGRN